MENQHACFGINGYFNQTTVVDQYTDNLNNQTSFCLHLHNIYNQSQYIQVPQIIELKCKYCKAFYFPEINKNNSYSNSQKSKKSLLKKITEHDQETKKYTCMLCGSINDIKNENFLKVFPKFQQHVSGHKQMQFNSCFQSVIVSQSRMKECSTKTKYQQRNENELVFMFYMDLDMLSLSLQLTSLTYIKTVIKEYFTQHLQNHTNQKQNQQENQQNVDGFLKQEVQFYSILITFGMNQKLFVADLNTMSTICIDSLLKQKLSPLNPAENLQEIQQQINERKQSLIELLSKSALKLTCFQSLQTIDQYIEMLIEERQSSQQQHRISFQGGLNFTKLMELLPFDKSSCRSYVVAWITGTPLINYQLHWVKKSNIYTIVYLFSEQNQNNTSQSIQSQFKFQQSNIRNEILLIKDNNQVKFIQIISQQENPQFYYLLYELFTIVESPKIFKPKWSIKTDAKYPPILTNDPPQFFIRNTALLYFIVSSLIDKSGHNKFQLSVQFQNWKKDEYVWIINWTKDAEKQSRQLKINRHNQIQLIPKITQIFNYFHILVKFMMNVAIRGKSQVSDNKRQLMSLNVATNNQLCMIIESMINHGMFRANNIQIGVEYLQRLYEYLNEMKGVPFEVLRFLSSCQYNMRVALLMILPLRIFHQQSAYELIHWGQGYTVLQHEREEYQDPGKNDSNQWIQYCLSLINEHQNKYYTKEYFINFENQQHKKHNSYENKVAEYYVNRSLAIIQNQQTKANMSQKYALTYRPLTQCILINYKQYSNQSDFQNQNA